MNQYKAPPMSKPFKMLRSFQRCAHLLYHRKGRTYGRGRILILLYQYGPMSQRLLQHETGMRSASLSEQVTRLEAEGYLERQRSLKDRRIMEIALTEAGIQAAQRLFKQRTEFAEELFSALTAEEQLFFEGCLSKLYTHWQLVCEQEDQQ